MSKNQKNNQETVIERLFEIIQSRKNVNDEQSYTSQLFKSGAPEIAKKVGEEAVETVIAALTTPSQLASESADLIYHLLVLWSASNIKPSDVWKELERRQGISGIKEKSLRK
ncbi:MAG: phosphoribosyl-ATP diphosphatase [Rhodospirillales bacterium]|nr:phosphoribosyl-ATP diphosphatase [Rhodospirillales bacterium]